MVLITLQFESDLLQLKILAIQSGISPEDMISNSFAGSHQVGGYVVNEPSVKFALGGFDFELIFKRSGIIHLKSAHKIKVFSLPQGNIALPSSLAAAVEIATELT